MSASNNLLAGLLLAFGLAAPAAALAGGDVALWVGRVDNGQVLEAVSADVPLNPASTMKLVTSFAALDTLGPQWRWRSELKSAAPIVGDTLSGDLVWVGRGDPLFDLAALDTLLGELRLRGVRRIAGRLLLDKGAFANTGSADDFAADAERAFTVAPDTHLTHLKVAWLHFYHDSAGVRVALEPALAGVTLEQQLDDDPAPSGPCGDVRRRVSIRQQGERIQVSGRLPQSCDGASSFVNVLSADEYAAQAFAARWARLGGSGPAGFAPGTAGAGAATLAGYDSPPLAQALVAINQHSNNTMARSVFLTLGSERGQSGDTVRDAAAVVRASLAAHGVEASSLVLENGSGLSRRERISARALGEMLRAAARSPFAAEFIASLPAAGSSGTLRHRLGNWGSRLRLKTGTLASVAALAGYWLAPDGRPLVIVAIDNRGAGGAARLDSLLDAVLARHAQLAPVD